MLLIGNIFNWKANLPAEDYLTLRPNSSQGVTLTQLLTSSEPKEFKPTKDIVITALNDHLLKDSIVSFDHLEICETLGEGEIYNWCVHSIKHQMHVTLDIPPCIILCTNVTIHLFEYALDQFSHIHV